MIRAFGLAGVISMLIALVTVLALLPALGMLIAPTGARVASLSSVDTGVNALRAFCDWIADRMTRWVELQRELAGRLPRRYASIEEAFKRMQEANRHLSPEQARHLTQHGVNQNEDGTYSWKFDNYVRVWPPYDLTQAELEELWARIACPTLLVYGKESWASNPAEDGRAAHFQNAQVVLFEKAGHWVHHDQLGAFLDTVSKFLVRP